MALDALRCNHLAPLGFRGLNEYIMLCYAAVIHCFVETRVLELTSRL